MEFYALGCYLASNHGLANGKIHQSPWYLQKMILKEWLKEFYPSTTEVPRPPKPLEHLQQEFNYGPASVPDFLKQNIVDEEIYGAPETG